MLLLTNKYPFTTQCQLLTPLRKNPLENIVEKGEKPGNSGLVHLAFSSFPTTFSKDSFLGTLSSQHYLVKDKPIWLYFNPLG